MKLKYKLTNSRNTSARRAKLMLADVQQANNRKALFLWVRLKVCKNTFHDQVTLSE
jgi:hypothetical protein